VPGSKNLHGSSFNPFGMLQNAIEKITGVDNITHSVYSFSALKPLNFGFSMYLLVLEQGTILFALEAKRIT